MLRRHLFLVVTLVPFLAAAQQPPTGRVMQGVSRTTIEEDDTYLPRLANPAYQKNGLVVLLDEGHGNHHFDKAFIKLASADGYQVITSKTPFTFEELSKVKVLVIMNAGMIMPVKWRDNPEPVVNDVEVAAVKDWVVAGGSLLFASGSNKAEAGELLLSRLGIELLYDPVHDRDLLPPGTPPSRISITNETFAREKNMFSAHAILAGRSEAERVDIVAAHGFQAIRKAPGNAITLIHCSGKAAYFTRDALMRKQLLEAQHAIEAGPQKESQTAASPVMAPTPAPGIPVAVAFTLGKGRVVVLGNSSILSSITRATTFQGQPLSDKIGLGEADNEKFTLNTLHWLSGLME